MKLGVRNSFNLLWTGAFLMFLPAGLIAQTPSITLNSVTLTIDPQTADGYILQGTFSGLSFANAQSVILSVGQFAGELSITDLVQQPGSNIFSYQDSTGLAPSWLSTLTIDLDVNTFTARAAGIVLAGLPNPFAVQLGTENGAACTMARVQATDVTTWQLTVSDGNQKACAIAVPPKVSPPSVLVNTSTDVQFQTAILPTAHLDPATIQLFRADRNGQPVGAALCTLQNSGAATDAGKYGCVANFAESNVGLIPLVVQANAGSNLILSPGFALLVVQPVSQGDVDALNGVNDAVNSAWQKNFAAYGDSAQARVQTLAALRTLALPGVAQIRLLEDQLSIGVLLRSGMPYSLILNRLDEGQANAAQASANSAPAMLPRIDREAVTPGAGQKLGARLVAATASSQPLACGSPQRPVVKNNQVIVWKSPFFPEPTTATLLAQQLQGISCPSFQVTQVDATIANAATFSSYGTVIIDSHGGTFGGDVEFLTAEPAALAVGDPRWDMVQNGLIGSASAPALYPNVYLTVTSQFFASQSAFQQTITFASACWSAYGNAMSNVLAASGGAYYGFTSRVLGTTTRNGATVPGFSERIAPQVFDQLLKSYVTAADAYQAVDHNPMPGEEVPSDRRAKKVDALKDKPEPKGLFTSPIQTSALFVLQPENSQLAYLGNPVLLPQQGGSASYVLGNGAKLDLKAQLEGASSCDGSMNYHWTNTAKAGNLMPAGGGQQDDFTVTDANATYQASKFLQGIDVLTVDFLPDPSNPPMARACGVTDVANQKVLHVVFDGHGTYSEKILPEYYEVFGENFSADLSWHAAWDMVLNSNGVGFPGAPGQLLEPPLPGSSLSGTTTVNAPELNAVCSGPPIADPTHDGFTASMVQTPLMGARYYNSSPPNSTVVQMWAETFGGDDYRMCDGHYLVGVGTYASDDPGYPGFDTLPGYVKFDIDLSQWVNQPDHSMKVPVSTDFYTVGDRDSGESHVNGVLTLTSQSVNSPGAAPSIPRATAAERDRERRNAP